MKWEKGVAVRRIDNPAKTGETTGLIRQRPGMPYYGVRWVDGTTDYVAEDQLEPQTAIASKDRFVLIEAGRYGRADDLRRSLTHVHLSGRLANLVYSMGITNTEFYPHQYKPLLTLLESPASGLLIADEVGLGKTIEAGIIWTELRAREDMRRLLIVCPAMLCEKWRDELKLRFGIDASIVNARGLVDDVGQLGSGSGAKAWVASYQSLRPPKAWRSGGDLPQHPSGRQQLAHLLDESVDEDPLFDLVVFDEAHYMRNPDSGAHKLGEMLQRVSHYRVLLSATPINLDNLDLFYLLQLCDPDHFQYPQSFQSLLSANRPLVAARDAALRMDSKAEEIVAHLAEAASSDLLQGSRQIMGILSNPPTSTELLNHRYRAELAASLERVNLLGHVITRTRKRDVQIERPKREVHPERVDMTSAERRFYEYVTEVTREYAWRKGISDGFLLATPQRQVCSCPAAFARAWLGDSGDLAQDLADQAMDEMEEGEVEWDEDDISNTLKDFLLANRPRSLDPAELERTDSKLERLVEVLSAFFRTGPKEKVILFTSFRVTAKYLSERLSALGMTTMLLWGNMAESKQSLINEFRERSDLRVLVSTEVASEGVDLQFSRLLVNYDLPWNPMRVEQRIGRIDRLGQKAKLIHIWNLFYRETIDERIFTRLLARLRIFEEALGEPEPIIGDTIQRLESRLLTTRLTPVQEDEEIQRAALALENVRKRQEDLERNASQMMAHGGLILERIAAAKELARRVTEADLVIYVSDFLRRHAAGHQLVQLEGDHAFTIQLPPAIAAELDDFCRRKGILGQTGLGNGLPRQCRFVNSLTSSSKSWEVIHQFHPLIRFIGDKLKQLDEGFYPLVAVRQTRSVDGVAPGDYLFAVRRWTFSGVNEEEWLQAAAVPMHGDCVPLPDEVAETLVNEVRLYGADWLEAAGLHDSRLVAERLDSLEIHLNSAYLRARGRKQDENADRLMFQLHGIDQQLERRMSMLNEVLFGHILKERAGLVKATQGRIDKLKATMALKREQVQRRETLRPDDEAVCVGLIRVQ